MRIVIGIGVTLAAVITIVAGDSCSSSEMTSTDTYLAQYADQLTNDCTIDICSSKCIETMNEIADALPDCDYIEGVNYHETMAQSIAACESITTGSLSTTDDEGSSEAGEASGLSPTAGICSDSEVESTDTYVAQYADAMSTNCGADWSCTSDCIDTLTELAASVPDCVYSDGVNYFETFELALTACSTSSLESSVSSSGSSSSTFSTGTACSTSENSDTNVYLVDVYTEYTAECSTDMCSSGCVEIMNTLASELPDCVSSDGNNYYESVSAVLASCDSSPTTTESSGSYSLPSFLRTETPAASSTGSNSKSDATSQTGSASLAFAGVVITAATSYPLL